MSVTRRSFIKTGTVSLAARLGRPPRLGRAGKPRVEEPHHWRRAATPPRKLRRLLPEEGLTLFSRRGDEPPLLHQGRLVAERARLRRRPQPQEGPRLGLPGVRGRARGGARPSRPGGQDLGRAREPLCDDRRRPQGHRRLDREPGHGPGPACLRGPRVAADPDGGPDRRRRSRHRGLPRHEDGQRDRLHGPGQPHHQAGLPRRL
jgi:hypothetical protein